MRATKKQTEKVVRVINGLGYGDLAELIDWSYCGDGYAILTHMDACELSMSESLLDAMPAGLWCEAINSGSLRVYRS